MTSTGDLYDGGAGVLSGPLTTLSDPADQQIEYLSGRAQEPDLGDLDVRQELLDEFGESLELAMPALQESQAAVASLHAIDAALRAPGLGDDVGSLRTDPSWENIRRLAADALRVLRAEALIPDKISFRLYPTRFAPILEPMIGPQAEWLAIVLNTAEFDRFTAEWEQALPSSEPIEQLKLPQIQEAAGKVYARYPPILEALGLKDS